MSEKRALSGANRALSRAEAARVVHALGSNESAQTRARATLARLVAQLLENYPSFAKEPSLASGVGARAARRRGASARDRTGSGRDADLRLGRRDRRSARWARRDRGRRGGARAGVGGEGDARSARSARGVDVSQRQRRVRRFGVSSRAPFLFTEKNAFSSFVAVAVAKANFSAEIADSRNARRIGWH